MGAFLDDYAVVGAIVVAAIVLACCDARSQCLHAAAGARA